MGRDECVAYQQGVRAEPAVRYGNSAKDHHEAQVYRGENRNKQQGTWGGAL